MSDCALNQVVPKEMYHLKIFLLSWKGSEFLQMCVHAQIVGSVLSNSRNISLLLSFDSMTYPQKNCWFSKLSSICLFGF